MKHEWNRDRPGFFSRKSLTEKRMTADQKDEHALNVMAMTQTFLANGGEIETCPPCPMPTTSRRAGIPKSA
jgi:hypothetical protein